jgi:tetratricopeptide (TPR) repeat protein
MKTKRAIWIVMLIGVVSIFLFSSNQSFAVSLDIQTAIKTHYRGNAEIETAKNIFEKVVADSNRNNEDRKYALIFLAILSFIDKDTKQADNYLCQILNLNPEFDPDLSVRDITEDFKKRFSVLKRQNSCPRAEQSCRGVKSFVLKKQLKMCDALFNQGIINYDCFQEAEKLCPNDPKVLELKRKIGDCDIAEKNFKDCTRSGKGTDTLSCYQEARALCPSHPKFLKKCLGKAENGDSETTTKCEALEKRLQECENNYTDTDEKTLFNKIRHLCKYRLRRCKNLLDMKIITTGNKETALSCYQEAQHLCPTHSSDIQQKFQDMEKKYIVLVKDALKKKLYKRAQRLLDGLKKVNPKSSKIPELKQRLQQLRQ